MMRYELSDSSITITGNLSFSFWSTLSGRRLLEADSKSMRSMSGSRRNSGSSLVSSSSASSNLSHLEEDTWILWGRIVNEWEEWRRKKDKLLKVGIQSHFFVLWGCGCSVRAHVKIIHHLLIFSSTSQHRSTKYCPIC